MDIVYDFIPAGSTVTPEKGKVFLDVGNDLCPGIIDNHSDKSQHCSSYLAYHNPEYVSKMFDPDKESFTIIVHKYPDYDAILSAYISTKIIQNKKLTENDKHLSEIADQVDRGLNPFSNIDSNNFLLYFYVMGRKSDLEKLRVGFEIFDHINKKTFSKEEILSGEALKENNPFKEFAVKIDMDYDFYLKDLEKSEVIYIDIYNTKKKVFEKIDGLIINQPESELFKYWGRSDREHSYSKKGFILLFVIFNGPRYIISVDPKTDYTLKGLGEALEKAELEKRKKLGKPREGKIRPGYNNPDPWYDGRAPIHNYTIVDTPMGGTVLEEEEVKEIFFDTRKWTKIE